MLFTDHITAEMRSYPQIRFICMGILDSCGTFLAAMGAVNTPGHDQPLLNQTLIPLTMLASACTGFSGHGDSSTAPHRQHSNQRSDPLLSLRNVRYSQRFRAVQVNGRTTTQHGMSTQARRPRSRCPVSSVLCTVLRRLHPLPSLPAFTSVVHGRRPQAVFLSSRYQPLELAGAGLIFAGACTSVVPGVLHAEQASVKWYAVLLYFLSNVPMACSAVYKACASLHSSLRHTRGDQALPCWAVLSLSLSLSLS